MEDRVVLVDTSIFIDFLRKRDKVATGLWRLREEFRCAMSSVTLFELLAGASDETKRADVSKLARWIDVLGFDSVTAEIAGEIYRDQRSHNGLIEFRDLFIAATARRHRLALATLNTRHFERVRGLDLIIR